jgi:hypothetical protein
VFKELTEKHFESYPYLNLSLLKPTSTNLSLQIASILGSKFVPHRKLCELNVLLKILLAELKLNNSVVNSTLKRVQKTPSLTHS